MASLFSLQNGREFSVHVISLFPHLSRDLCCVRHLNHLGQTFLDDTEEWYFWRSTVERDVHSPVSVPAKAVVVWCFVTWSCGWDNFSFTWCTGECLIHAKLKPGLISVENLVFGAIVHQHLILHIHSNFFPWAFWMKHRELASICVVLLGITHTCTCTFSAKTSWAQAFVNSLSPPSSTRIAGFLTHSFMGSSCHNSCVYNYTTFLSNSTNFELICIASVREILAFSHDKFDSARTWEAKHHIYLNRSCTPNSDRPWIVAIQRVYTKNKNHPRIVAPFNYIHKCTIRVWSGQQKYTCNHN